MHGSFTKKIRWLVWLLVLVAAPDGLWGQVIHKRVLAPGVLYMAMEDTLIPRRLFVVKINLGQRGLGFQTVKAKNQLRGLARLSEMARNFQGGKVVAAINGDFFGKSGLPINFQAEKGEILREPTAYSVFGFTDSGQPFIRRLKLKAEFFGPTGKSIAVNGVNRQWQKDEMVYFNSFFGDSTLANYWGTAVVLQPTQKNWHAGQRQFRVVRMGRRGKEAIPKAGGVLVCHGRAGAWVQKNVKPGQKVRLLFALLPLKEGVQEATGGFPQILNHGKPPVTYPPKDFALKRHPRTAVGISRDRKTVYWVVVDGRQPHYSLGMTLPELAHFLREQGAYDALNLDGGGSTTLIIQGKIANRPCDAGGERPISNGWILFRK